MAKIVVVGVLGVPMLLCTFQARSTYERYKTALHPRVGLWAALAVVLFVLMLLPYY
jgi:hypothetical protein